MRQVTITLYSFNELNEKAKQKAIYDHSQFMAQMPVQIENEHGQMVDIYEDYEDRDVIENIEANDYIFFEDGELAHCTHYTGKHEKAGTTEFHFHWATYDITK